MRYDDITLPCLATTMILFISLHEIRSDVSDACVVVGGEFMIKSVIREEKLMLIDHLSVLGDMILLTIVLRCFN